MRFLILPYEIFYEVTLINLIKYICSFNLILSRSCGFGTIVLLFGEYLSPYITELMLILSPNLMFILSANLMLIVSSSQCANFEYFQTLSKLDKLRTSRDGHQGVKVKNSG